MSPEKLNFHQLPMPGFETSGGRISPDSDWTKFAEEHGLKIYIRPIIHRSKSTRLGGETVFDNNSHIFFDNPWKGFITGARFGSSIQEYKRSHNGKRPNWAMLYSEKDEPDPNYSFNRNFNHRGRILKKDEQQDGRFWHVEREDYEKSENMVTVIRYADTSGQCRRVVVFRTIPDKEIVEIRQEDWVSRASWEITSVRNVAKSEVCDLLPL